ncbi:MAG: helix-turn-helix transcriptional regulator [Anaerolineaceae bacterium]|nr:helix-turn-helix transcriptional regulator [Anaerolineaceae bacterium]
MKKNKSTNEVRTWGEKIAAYRKQAKITQLDLSLRTGITRDQISRLERGKSQPKLETIILIEKALNIPGWSLIEESVREAAQYRNQLEEENSRIITHIMNELSKRNLKADELRIIEKAILCMADSIHQK